MTAAVKLDVAHDADAFLRMLGDRHTFQTFGEGAAKAKRGLNRVLPGSLAEHAETLAGLNARGAGVFVTVNETDGKGRKSVNVQRVRALFVDLDGAPLEPIKAATLAPHCMVESSPNHWHAYWRIADCPLADFKPLQKALAARFNGDAKVCDPARVMRLPGFDHRKRAPYRSRIVELRAGTPYSVADVRAAFGFDATPAPVRTPRTLPDEIPEGERDDTLFSLGRGLACKGIDADGVNRRLQRINAERCKPPLCATEVDTIAANASAHGSDGFALLPHNLLDSPEWKALAPPSHDVVLRAFRRYDGSNNGRIALPFSDFAGLPGFTNTRAFYKHRSRVIASGILSQTKRGVQTRDGREADMFAIAAGFLREPLVQKDTMRISSKRHKYLDIQALVDSSPLMPTTQSKTEKTA